MRPVIDYLESRFQNCYIPEKMICIDESMVPFQGRLSFKQYNKEKSNRYGIKVFKLCANNYYTLKYKVYKGKEQKSVKKSASSDIVMELMENYLDCGRTLICDNWYTSVDLAEKLLQRDTHLLGTLRKNRKRNPKIVTQKKLKKGEYIGRQNTNNITVMKWKDKRDVLMLSTKHLCTFEDTVKKGKTKSKPSMVIEYNKGKSLIDRTDQMAAYIQNLRKSIKWYRKVVFDLTSSICILNAYILYTTITGTSLKITEFKEEIVKSKQ